jgi:cation diffusion facilitator family transporter
MQVNPTTGPECVVHVAPERARGESRTRWVTGVTALMMVAELVAGFWTHSLALTADGWHMMTHVGALGLAAVAYWYARTRAGETRFAFGTGKVYALAGYTSAAFLLGVAVFMAVQGVQRLLAPEDIAYREAIPVAVLGLLVNLVCAWILGVGGDHDHDHAHAHGLEHDHDHHHDHNLRAAYLHVLADALTSVLAIAALVLGQYAGWRWVDPVVALIGSAVIFKWGVGLTQECARQLVDLHPTSKQRDAVRTALEAVAGTRVADLHLWSVGPGRLVCVVAIESPTPRTLQFYRDAVQSVVKLSHLTVEVRPVTAPA